MKAKLGRLFRRAPREESYPTSRLVKDIAPFLWPYRGLFALATLLRLAGDLAWLYPAYGLASLIDFFAAYHRGDPLQPVALIFGLFVVAIVVRHAGLYAAKRIMFAVSERIALDAQMAAIAHMFELDIAWHERENTGNKLKRVVRGSESIDRILRIWINNIVEIAINFLGITFVIARFDTTIALLTVVFLGTYYTLAAALRRRAARAASVVNAQEEELHGVLFEALNNIRSVKVLGMARALTGILIRESDDLYRKIGARIFWFQTGNTARSFYAQLFQLGVIGFIVYGIVQGQYQVGFLVLFTGYFRNLLQSVGELADVTQDYEIAKLSVSRMVETLREPVGIDAAEGKAPFPPQWRTISLRKVSFGYGSVEVLRDVSFEIRRGEKIGIVGLSGAGKSTLFKLLLKEYESYAGEILVDETPLRRIDKRDYFRHAAVVLQDTEVFNFSLRNNIALANSAAAGDEALFEKAVRVAHVQDFLRRLPQGVDTFIGEKGVRLSGGERQRLGLARAVFKDPQLLLLDEATSHLDIESEEKIRASLHEFFRSVTAVVIAHRLTTIREMDRIVVIEGGRVVEQGSFDELMARKGRFHELWRKQSL